jgi:hypothetical protein
MKSTALFFSLTAAILFFTAIAVAQSPYYVLTNDNTLTNSATVFNLNPKNGSLSEVLTLETGGEAMGGGYFAGVTQIITPGAACVFVSEGGGTPDIAAFSKSTHYAKVGNYTDSRLGGGTNMPMITNAAGSILYAAYETTSNIGVWTINSDCSLTLANIVGSSDFLGSMAITHDGKTLLASYEIVKKIGSFTISGTNLTNNGAIPAPAQISGIAVTNDDQVVIMGTAYSESHPSDLVTANLPGFTNLKVWTVGPGYSAGSIALSSQGAAGNGCLYIGNTGGGNANQSGVTGVMFTESPLNLTYVNNVTSPQAGSMGTVQTITNTGNGGGVYAAETTGFIGVYAASSNCTVKLVKETLDPNAGQLISLTGWVQ